MDKNAKILIGAIVGVVLIWGIYAATRQQATAPTEEEVAEPASTEPIKVGFISPLTGDAAVYGEPVKNVTRLAIKEINVSGGISGRMLEVIYEDGKCNGKDAASAMQKLVSTDKVQFVLGGFCSSESLAAAPIANENKVVLFSTGSSSPSLTKEGGPFFFRDYPSDSSQGKVLAEVAYKKGWKSIAVIHEQTDYALGIAQAFSETFKSLGGTTAIEAFPTETTDFRTPLTKLQAGNPDAILVSVQTPNQAELILKQIKELNWKVNLMGGDVIPGSDLPKTQPDLVEGMLVAEFGLDREAQKFQKFLNAYVAEYGSEPNYLNYMQTVYDGVYIMKDAIAAVSYDGEKIRQWLDDVSDWQGVSGSVTFDENGDRTVGHQPEMIIGGKVVPFEG